MTHPIKLSSPCDLLTWQIKVSETFIQAFHSLSWAKIPPIDPSLRNAPQMPSLTSTRQQAFCASSQTPGVWFKQKIIQLVIFPRHLLEWICKQLQVLIRENPQRCTLLFYASPVLGRIIPAESRSWNCWEQKAKGRKVGGNSASMGHFQFYPTSWSCWLCCHVLLHVYIKNEELRGKQVSCTLHGKPFASRTTDNSGNIAIFPMPLVFQ